MRLPCPKMRKKKRMLTRLARRLHMYWTLYSENTISTYQGAVLPSQSRDKQLKCSFTAQLTRIEARLQGMDLKESRLRTKGAIATLNQERIFQESLQRFPENV